LGVWLAEVVPVEIWADRRRGESLATGHVPDMDPGTVVAIAAFIAIAPLLAVLLIEGVRCGAILDSGSPRVTSAIVAVGAPTAELITESERRYQLPAPPEACEPELQLLAANACRVGLSDAADVSDALWRQVALQ
jgi:hypothetical protein